jgi:hypothetical protein
MSLTEVLGFITGAASVWLAAKDNVWNWPIGIANSAFFLVLFFDAGPYANTASIASSADLRHGPPGHCVWHERYMGGIDADLFALASERRYALYVLTGSEIPWAQDGTCDGEHMRQWMTERFREVLRDRPEPFIEVSGTPDERLAQATAGIDRVLAEGWNLEDVPQPRS